VVRTRALLIIRFSRLASLHHPLEVGREFSQPVSAHTKGDLGHHTLITSREQIGIGGRLGSCNDTGTECAAIQGKLGTQVLLRTVIGYEVPDKGVACAWPKAGALAAIVSRLEAKEAIAQSHQGILRNKLSVARTESSCARALLNALASSNLHRRALNPCFLSGFMPILRAEYWASSLFDCQLLRPCTGGLPFSHQLPAHIIFVDVTNMTDSLSAHLFRYCIFNVVELQVWIQTHVRGQPPALLQTCGPCVVCRQGYKRLVQRVHRIISKVIITYVLQELYTGINIRFELGHIRNSDRRVCSGGWHHLHNAPACRKATSEHQHIEPATEYASTRLRVLLVLHSSATAERRGATHKAFWVLFVRW